MSVNSKIVSIKIALAFVSAIFVSSCSGAMKGDIEIEDGSKIPTVTTVNHIINYNENGKRSYRFDTPLMERYEMVKEPYMEFKKGIHIETFNDSTKQVASELFADYAIYNEVLKLWEAKGNVRGRNADGDKIFTEQLFWDETTDQVYSDVDTKIIRGEEVTIGAGFRSDGAMKNIEYRQTKGLIYVDTTANKGVVDTLSVPMDSVFVED